MVKTPRASPNARLPIITKEDQNDGLPPRKSIKLDHPYSASSLVDALQQTKVTLAETSAQLLEKQKEVKLLKRKRKRKDDKLSSLIETLNKTRC